MSERDPDESVVGGEVDRLDLSLRFGGDSLDPDAITHALQISPTFAARKGQSIERNGRVHSQPTGIWSLALPASGEWELSDAIRTLLAMIPVPASVVRRLATEYHGDVFCGLFLERVNRGCVLVPDVLGALAERNLELGLDIYGPGDPAA